MSKKIIVPFLFCSSIDKENYAWIFCKYADFCLNNDMPIIAEEEYCMDIDLVDSYEKGTNPHQCYYTAKSPTLYELQSQLKKVLITMEEKEKYLSEMDIDNSKENREKLFLEENDAFERLIDIKINEVESQYGKVDIIMTWIRYPALIRCASRRNIVVLAQELSIIRGNDYYREVFGYFNFGEKYTSDPVTRGYQITESALDSEMTLNRKEILALVLETEHLDVLNRLEESIYEFGVDADADRDSFFRKYSKISQRDILKKGNRQIMMRSDIKLPQPFASWSNSL